MKKINLNNNDYFIPTSWDEVSLAMQIKVSADSDKILIDDLKKFAILSGYASIPIDVLKHAKLQDLKELFTTMEFINTDIPDKPLIEFDFNGKHYYCGQNLIDMEFQDFISIENVIKAESGNTYNALPTILAIMCKQKKANGIFESLDDYDVLKRSQEFLGLPISIANGLSLFFSINENLFSVVIPSFSKPETVEAVMQKQINDTEVMLKSLAGRGLLMRCVSGILRYLLKYIKRHYNKHYTSTV